MMSPERLGLGEARAWSRPHPGLLLMVGKLMYWVSKLVGRQASNLMYWVSELVGRQNRGRLTCRLANSPSILIKRKTVRY